MTPFQRLRMRYGTAVVLAAGATVVVHAVEHFVGGFNVARSTVDDPSTRGTLFTALITIAGILLTVLLGVLAVITSLGDDRHVVKVMKEELKNYDELVHRLVGPIIVSLVVALLGVVCLVLPSDTSHALRGWLALVPEFTIALALGVMLQTAGLAYLISDVLLFKRRGPTASDTPAAVDERIGERFVDDPPPERAATQHVVKRLLGRAAPATR